VLDWHNFLTSISTWNLEDWQGWIRGLASMRYNSIMVHLYGNNPMFTFRHNGQTKPVGYLASTQVGRDWSTMHINDVRRMWGGHLFDSPVFGTSAALAPEEKRAAAAQDLARKAFAYARSYGLHVTFALDLDTETSNPQNIIINTLPASARFPAGKLQFANPDTPEGYAYYRSQVAQLIGIYPQVDRILVWFRGNRVPFRNTLSDLKPEECSPAWNARYKAALASQPRLHDYKTLLMKEPAPVLYALDRITAAYTRAAAELAPGRVEIGVGSWGMPPDGIFAPNVKSYGLLHRFQEKICQDPLNLNPAV
jgi:hypothetical protein